MTIERLSFPNGYVFLPQADWERGIETIFQSHRLEIQLVPEGEYKLTPPHWTNHAYEHFLIVLSTGEGVYQLLPRDATSWSVDWLRHNNLQVGGRVFHLPRDQTYACLSGSAPHNPLELAIFEFIRHTPGPNP
jgi:hypothetical protein